MLSWFKRKKHQPVSPDTAAPQMTGEEITKAIAEADSLRLLGRHADSQKLLHQCEAALRQALERERAGGAHGWAAYILNSYNLAVVLNKTGSVVEARQILVSLKEQETYHLLSKEFVATPEGEVFVRVERLLYTINAKTTANTDNMMIYSCQKCGKLINFITSPCPYCQWLPSTEHELVKSLALSSDKLDVSDLLLISRALGKGIVPVVPGLEEFVAQYESDVARRPELDTLTRALETNSQKKERRYRANAMPNLRSRDRIIILRKSRRGHRLWSCIHRAAVSQAWLLYRSLVALF